MAAKKTSRKAKRAARKSGNAPKRRTMLRARFRAGRVRNALVANGVDPRTAARVGNAEGTAIVKKKGFAVRGGKAVGTARSRKMAAGKRGGRQRRDSRGKFR